MPLERCKFLPLRVFVKSCGAIVIVRGGCSFKRLYCRRHRAQKERFNPASRTRNHKNTTGNRRVEPPAQASLVEPSRFSVQSIVHKEPSHTQSLDKLSTTDDANDLSLSPNSYNDDDFENALQEETCGVCFRSGHTDEDCPSI